MNPLRWRKMTWLIWIFTLFMGLWIASAIVSNSVEEDCTEETELSQEACEAASNVGTGLGVTILFCGWLLGFLILTIIWFMTRPIRRICPVCGTEARKGRMVCRKCGFDFATGTAPRAAPAYAQAPRADWLCPSCGAPNPAGARFCGTCGAPIAPVAPTP